MTPNEIQHLYMRPAVLLTAWLAIVFYTWTVLRLAGEKPGHPTSPPRFLWSLGGAVFLFHVLGAFSAFHDWSHQAAVEHTALQSMRVTGFEAGWGIYVNYLFLAVWIADLAWWWRVGDARYRARKPAAFWALHGFFLFMIFFGGFFFVDRPQRWVGLAATILGLASVILISRRQTLQSATA